MRRVLIIALVVLIVACLVTPLVIGCGRHSKSPSPMVHVTRTGQKYHKPGCRFLSKSDIPMSRKDAEAEGYEPCSVCSP